MARMTNDTPGGAQLGAGLLFAISSATAFGLSGSLARGLLDAGWSAGAVVLVRLSLSALVVAPLAVRELRGRWGALRNHIGFIALFGALPVAGAQFGYFSAVQRMDVGPALLIEYTAPAAVVIWLWLRHGERPGVLTVTGAGVAALGLVLVLDLLSGADLAPLGVFWALFAMVGAASYFVLAAPERPGLPPVALGGAGLTGGGLGPRAPGPAAGRAGGPRADGGRIGARRPRRGRAAADDRHHGPGVVRGRGRPVVAAADHAGRGHRRVRLLHRDSP